MPEKNTAVEKFPVSDLSDLRSELMQSGLDSWQAAALPENANVWYNSLPKILGFKGVGGYAQSPRDYYNKHNILYLPGAVYPEKDTKLVMPLFAFAINTKLRS